MGFVDNCLVERGSGRFVFVPVKIMGRNHTARHARGRIGVVQTAGVGEMVTENRFTSLDVAVDSRGVRVKQQFGPIAAQSLVRRPGAVHPQAISLAWSNTWDEPVPDMCATQRELNACL